ncbi:MAG TPA: hypothetical protein VK927_05450 [Adhaeribacter sp.]|nr:hypothetical protein [Adhaeribacter sp.]
MPESASPFPRSRFHVTDLLLYAGMALLVLLSLKNSFFWDSILLGSRYGQWYYDTDFQTAFVPENMAGYPPLFGMLVALAWKIFGRSLEASHLLILPFALGIVAQVLSLSRKFLPPAAVFWSALLILLDPTLLAQCTQVAPDVLLVFLFLFCLNKIIEKKPLQLAVALVFLGMLSPRGTIAAALVFASHLWLYFFQNGRTFSLKTALNVLWPYVPAGLAVLTWQFLHYRHFGWAGYNPNENYAEYTKFSGFSGMLRNTALIIWRTLDFGRLLVWLGLALTLWAYFSRRLSLPPATLRLFGLFLIPFLGFSAVFLPFTNPIGHRYYLVPFLLLALLGCYLLMHLPDRTFRRSVYALMLLGLLSGHFWLYPDTVAKGWDATLAHTPYFSLRQKAIGFLDKTGIPVAQTGSDFPNLAPIGISDLSNDSRQFKPKDLATDRYILWSNVFNNFSDEELHELKTRWQVRQMWQKGQVRMVLYERPATTKR